MFYSIRRPWDYAQRKTFCRRPVHVVDLKKDKWTNKMFSRWMRINGKMIKNKTMVSHLYCAPHFISETFRLFVEVIAFRGSVIDYNVCRWSSKICSTDMIFKRRLHKQNLFHHWPVIETKIAAFHNCSCRSSVDSKSSPIRIAECNKGLFIKFFLLFSKVSSSAYSLAFPYNIRPDLANRWK